MVKILLSINRSEDPRRYGNPLTTLGYALVMLFVCLPPAVHGDVGAPYSPAQRDALTLNEIDLDSASIRALKRHHQVDASIGYRAFHSKFRKSGYEHQGLPDQSARASVEAITDSFFGNKYTFAIVDAPELSASQLALIEANAIAVINYVADYVSWRGTLDFAVHFLPFDYWDVGGKGLLPSLGGVTTSGYTWAAEEALTGVDANGDAPDIGCYILPNVDGRLTNYDVPLSFDGSPDFYEAYVPPAETHDFASIFLHEVLHSLAFWSNAQHGDQYQRTVFDELTMPAGDRHEFIGGATNRLLEQNLNLAYEGSRDHYAATPALLNGGPEVDRGAMFMYGNYEKNRWHIGKLELAVLEDLGYTVANSEYLNLVEQSGAEAKERPVNPSERPAKAFSDLMNTLESYLGG